MNPKMKKELSMNSLKMLLLGLLFSTMYACGGGSNEQNGAQSTEGGTENTEAAVVDNGEGIGTYVGKEIAGYDAALADKGKTVFETKCAACHKVTSEKVVGPGLKGVTEKRKAQWILNMITNPVEMTQKDAAAQALLAEHLTQMTFQDVNENDALALLNYLRQNDGAK